MFIFWNKFGTQTQAEAFRLETGHNYNFTLNHKINSTVSSPTARSVERIFQFKTILKRDVKFIFIACNEKSKPIFLNNEWKIEKHTHSTLRSMIISNCNTKTFFFFKIFFSNKGENQCDLVIPSNILLSRIGLSAFLTINVLYLVMIILCIWFRNVQPLKSRGMTPMIFLFFGHIVNSSSYPTNFLVKEQYVTYGCFLSAGISNPATAILFLLWTFVREKHFYFKI